MTRAEPVDSHKNPGANAHNTIKHGTTTSREPRPQDFVTFCLWDFSGYFGLRVQGLEFKYLLLYKSWSPCGVLYLSTLYAAPCSLGTQKGP